MTFLELRQLVSGYVDDVDNGYFTVSDVNRYINLAMYEVQKIMLQAFEDQWIKCVETTIFPNQIDYQLPADFKKLNRLDIVVVPGTPQTEVTNQLSKITRNQQNAVNNANYNNGYPTVYYFTNNSLTIRPVPSVQKTMRMNYTYRIADMVQDTDVPDIPDEYQDYGAVLAAITCLTRDGRVSQMLVDKKDYYEKQLKRDAEQRNIDMPRTVVQTVADDTDFIW